MISNCRLGTLSLFACLMAVGCGGATEGQEGPGTQEIERNESELRPKPTFYSIEPNLLPCLPPSCGGYDVRPLNDMLAPSFRIVDFDFSSSGLTPEEQQTALQEPVSEVVLKGVVEGSRLHVLEAYRGLPGVSYKHGARFYTVQPSGIVCIKEPCPTIAATAVNTGKKELISEVNVTRAAQHNLVQDSWLLARAYEGRAILAGGIATTPGVPPGTPLMAEQVFIRLPEVAGPCPLEQILCEEPGTVATFTRSPDRCLVFDSCKPQGFCPAYFPICDDGYKLVQWNAGQNQACPAFACDPVWAN